MDIDINKVVEFKNRYGTVLEFKRTSISEFLVSNIPNFFARRSMTESGETVMYDPSGGPYIGAEIDGHPGTDMGYYDDEWKGLIVNNIEILEGDQIILRCYGVPVEWDQIK